jgi:hypothetical protein
MITGREELEEACEPLRNLAAAHRGNAAPILVSSEWRLDTNSPPDRLRLHRQPREEP